MSVTNVEESSFLKVKHDFEYRTNDGCQVSIKKDEKLYLIQKTNSDWWKVIRNQEQRSFYVPVTYVTELGKLSLPKINLRVEQDLQSQDDEQLFQRNSKDHSDTRKHVEKWLSNTVNMSQHAAEGSESLEDYNKLENIKDSKIKEIRNRIEQQKQGLQRIETSNESGRSRDVKNEKSLERFKNVVKKISKSLHASDASLRSSSARNSQTSDGLPTVMENVDDKLFPDSTCLVYSPKMSNENSLDFQSQSQHPIQPKVSDNKEPAMKCSNTTDSAESSNDKGSANSDSLSIKCDPTSKSFNEELNSFILKSSAIKRYTVNNPDRRLIKPNIEKRPSSPISVSKNTSSSSVSASPPSSTMFDYSENAMKILNDKRKSWAVEELMTELTQIRKERVDNNVSNFVLRSIAIKDRFDPLEKLTQELHDLHTTQDENSSVSGQQRLESTSQGNIKETEQLSPSRFKKTKAITSKSYMNLPRIECSFDKSKSPKNKILLTDNDKVCSIKVHSNSAMSTKWQDEYEEANILNDESRMPIDAKNEGSNMEASLSTDKKHYVSTYQKHSQLFKVDTDNIENFEKPSYSNISIKLENEVKIRPQLKLKIKSIDTKIRLTPSLEKLASEIQFLPASKTSVLDNDSQQSTLTKNNSLQGTDQNEPLSKLEKNPTAFKEPCENSDNLINVQQDREMWKNFKSKLTSKSSFNSKQERKSQILSKDVSFQDDCWKDDIQRPRKIKLKKSATFNCIAIPEYYKHFQRHEGSAYNSCKVRAQRFKRRSQSLEDLKLLMNMELSHLLETSKKSNVTRNNLKPELGVNKSIAKPIPSPRNIVTMKGMQGRTNDNLSHSYKDAKPNVQVLPPIVSKSYETLNNDFTNLKVFNANKSTAVSFKNLLCTSDSGSEEYLHYKAFPKSSVNKNEHSAYSLDSKINSKIVVSLESLPVIDRSASERQILSSNISSETLFSQSESEVYALSEFSNNSSPVTMEHDRENLVNIPPGWMQEYDAQLKQICFVNVRGEKWFSSNDAEGKIYFFEENSNESSWALPNVNVVEPALRNKQDKHEEIELRSNSESERFRIGKARSMVVGNQRMSKKEPITRRSGSISHDWPQLFDGNMCILKEGTLQRTKITENGKKLRKNWSTSYVVLSELFLLFFKDAKTFSAMKSGQSAAAKPEISVDLNGATVEPGNKASSRKNVYIIGTILGLQVLIQSDNNVLAKEWFEGISDVISKLPSSLETQALSFSLEQPRDVKNKLFLAVNSADDNKIVSKVGRSRSIKIKKVEGSTEDLSGSSAERQTKIKAKLKRFFQRRPTIDAIVKNGIYKDEPFGSRLEDVCSRQPPMIPHFVKACIEILESNPENMKADGLYRASGNLSQIQKIRLQVDQNNLGILAQEEDVHVLTGALKLFFRELKEPLIPYEFFEQALKAASKEKSERIQVFRDIVRALSPAHYDTLQFLLQHLLKVTSYQEYNRMHIPNLAIVFGPTLMRPKDESANMALDLMQQNMVIECLLSDYDKIFK